MFRSVAKADTLKMATRSARDVHVALGINVLKTGNSELEELLFWCYACHGLGKEKARTLDYYSTPHFDTVFSERYFAATDEFLKYDRKVKGGELFLHKFGFCDLHGLLTPWIAAIKEKSINAEGPKKNKHLVIILDSCHSGVVAQELNEFKEQMQDKGLFDENTVTIQSACGPDERTQGGYFTPTFVYLNDPENEELLGKLKVEWEKMSEESREEYKSTELPSPMVVTTGPQPQGVTMEVNVQNFKLTLFPDPGFFRFCSKRVYQDQDVKAMSSLAQDRVLNPTSASTFLSGLFTVLDYKLKTYKGTGPMDPYAGTPMGLFLLDDPNNRGYAVCAHIHFKKGDTSKPQRINLVHHKAPPMGSVLYTQDRPATRIDCTADLNAARLVQACKDKVNDQEPGRWDDDSQWNMTSGQLGVIGEFRLRERSAWEDKYLKYIEQFELPKVQGSSPIGSPDEDRTEPGKETA